MTLEELQEENLRLTHRIAEQRKQLAEKEEALRQRNLALDALHHIWCDGGCLSGVHRWTEGTITEDLVRQAEREVKRLRVWWDNRCFKDTYYKGERHYSKVPFLRALRLNFRYWWFCRVHLTYCRWRYRKTLWKNGGK